MKFALISSSPWPPNMDGCTPSLPGLQATLAENGVELRGCWMAVVRGGLPAASGISCSNFYCLKTGSAPQWKANKPRLLLPAHGH